MERSSRAAASGIAKRAKRWRGLIALGVFGLLLAYVLKYERGPVPEPGESPTVGALLGLRGDDVSGAWFDSGAGRIEIRREGERWMLVRPLHARCDRWEAERVTTQLLDQRVDGVLGKVDTVSQYGLDRPRLVVHLRVRTGTRQICFGEEDPAGTSVYVRERGRGPVFLLPAYLVDDMRKKKAEEMRDKSVVDITTDKIASVAVETRSERVEARKVKDGWELTAPERRKADRAAVDDLLFKLTGIRAIRFATAEEVRRGTGLQSPQVVVTVKHADTGERQGVALGAKTSSGIYARRLDDNEVLVLSPDVLRDLKKGPADLMDKTIQPARMEEIDAVVIEGTSGRIELVRQGAEWRMLRPKAVPVRRDRVENALLWDLGEMKAGKVLAQRGGDLRRWGLDKPWLKVHVSSKRWGTVSLLFGKRPGEDVPVKSSRSETVYSVGSWMADRLNLKAEDLR